MAGRSAVTWWKRFQFYVMENFKLANQLISVCCWTSGNPVNLYKYVIFEDADGMLAIDLMLLGLIA